MFIHFDYIKRILIVILTPTPPLGVENGLYVCVHVDVYVHITVNIHCTKCCLPCCARVVLGPLTART